MKLGDDLIKKMSGKYEPSAMLPLHYRNNDIILRTDREGNAVQMFIGKANSSGIIKGDRYSRTIVRDREGKVIKDYWERKGRAS
ncbi:MAG TPA: hypothetical protein VFR58_14985 [Flavisolibacter sp.]|nr:hypothetical protein [Flavisolibacter sp.]